MDSDLQQLVETERVPAHLASKLEKLTAGTCCTHRSWGHGKIREWDCVAGRMLIDFAGRPGHPMEFPYAATSLTPLPDTHIESCKINDLAQVKELAKTDALALMRVVLLSVMARPWLRGAST